MTRNDASCNDYTPHPPSNRSRVSGFMPMRSDSSPPIIVIQEQEQSGPAMTYIVRSDYDLELPVWRSQGEWKKAKKQERIEELLRLRRQSEDGNPFIPESARNRASSFTADQSGSSENENSENGSSDADELAELEANLKRKLEELEGIVDGDKID